MFKWILFDQANVLTHHVFTTKDVYCNDHECFPAQNLEKIYYTKEHSDFELGKINSKELIAIFLRQNNLCLTVQGYAQLFKDSIEPIEGMREVVEALKPNFRLATLINEGTEWAEHKFNALGYKHLFEKNIISGDLGVAKPDEVYYQKALQTLNTEPSQCLFIDDQEKNVHGAEQLGIKSILFQNRNQLINELKQFSINL